MFRSSGYDMLKTTLRASTVLALILAAQLALSSSAQASGLSAIPAEPAVMSPAQSQRWGTPYIGLHLGCSWLDESDDIQSENGPCDAVGGVHAGVNFPPNGNFVWGGEIDFTSSDHRFSGPVTGGHTVSTDWEASLRLRLGYMISENTMLYTTGGIGFANAGMTGAGSNTHTGWTLGLGAEHSFSERWMGRVELRHSDYGSKTYDSPTGPFDVGFGTTRLMVGLSYKF